MHNLMKQDFYTPSLQETSDTLALRGIRLTPEDFRALKQTQLLVCEKCHWIETSSTILEQILSPFLNSPYLGLQNYLNILKNTIVVYYETRSRFDWRIEDARIIHELYHVYCLQQGEQDIEYLRTILKSLKKERDRL